MANFSDAFRKLKDTHSFKQVIAGLPGQAILSTLNNFRDHLQTNCGPQDSIICALTSSEELISDKFIDEGEIHFDSGINDFKQVPDDIVNDLVSGLSEGLHKGESATTFEGVTLTDGTGRSYNIIDQRSNDVYIDGYHVLFSYTYNVSRVSEAMLMVDGDGHYVLNNFIRTADFVKDQGRRVKPTTLLGLLKSIHLIMYGSDSFDTLFENAISIADAPAEPDIQSALYDYVTTIDDPYTDEDRSCFAMASWLWDREDSLNPLPQGQGKITSLWSVIKDQIESSTLNQFLLNTCNDVIGGFNNTTAITSTIIEAAQSKYKSIRCFGNGIAHAFNRGGVYGVACYIVTYLKDITEVGSDDGVLQFSDNTRLTPQIYIAGLIQTIVTVVGTLVSIIVTIFSRIAGAILAVITSFTSQFFKIFQYDFDSTRAALNTSDKVLTPTAPYGVIQEEYTASRLLNYNADLKSLYDQGIYLVYCIIPGGCLIIGPGSFDSSGIPTTIRVELHPLIIECHDAFNWTVTRVNQYIYADGVNANLKFNSNTLTASIRNNIANDLLDQYSDEIEDYTVDNESDNVLSSANDQEMRRRICENLFIAGVFLMCCGGHFTLFNSSNRNQFYSLNHDEDDFWLTVTDTSDTKAGFWMGYRCFASNLGSIPWAWGSQHGYTLYLRENNAVEYPTWKELSSRSINTITTVEDLEVYYLALCINKRYYDNFNCMASNSQHAIFIPKYDSATFWAVVVASIVITAVVAAAVAVVTVKAKKAINRQRGINQAKVQKAHQALADDPTAENYNAYRKAVRKNNMWANLIGGTKYDYVNYWNGDTSADTSEGSIAGDTLNPFDSYVMAGTATIANNDTDINEANAKGNLEMSDLSVIQRLICGHC